MSRSDDPLAWTGVKAVHPGPFFARRILGPRTCSTEQAAIAMGLEERYLAGFIDEEFPLDPQLADKLSSFSGVSYQFWLNLQENHDQYLERKEHSAA